MRSEFGWLLRAAVFETGVAAAAVACPEVPLSTLLVVGPLLAAQRLPTRATAAFAAVATLLVLAIPTVFRDTVPPPTVQDHAVRVALIAFCSLWAVLTAHDRTLSKAALEHMTHLAEVSQQALARPLPAELGGLAMAVRSRSASEGALVGGDLHDAVLMPSGPRLIIGDVTGHGLGAVRLSSAVLCAFRHTAATEPDLVRLAHTLDDRVRTELGDEDFVTLLLADFVPGGVHLVNCGHPPPLRVGGRLDLLESPDPSPPLGLSPTPRLHTIRLSPEQRILLYTDGLTEARNAKGAALTFDRAVRAALSAPALDEALTTLVDLVDRHTADSNADDLTLLLVQPDPESLTEPRPHAPKQPIATDTDDVAAK
ncbi:PP2C family protein-serine/threonine phosphatase [Streptomyces chrestomyceticus]|uniref:PP2C family protein-serine/threonine phosphatase n=1 Tax=Streptomyces chrestomyceticus TaxID=68185 RepID=UPI0033F896B5